ncbi:putative transposase for insertion sequence element IS5377 [Trichinella spiralis]|uniref:Transposase for insertion sequence element IS5377 n=1 Tax=Trichinella spiralis TaxID=6334 RepID=A0ABR3KAU2_TRISP
MFVDTKNGRVVALHIQFCVCFLHKLCSCRAGQLVVEWSAVEEEGSGISCMLNERLILLLLLLLRLCKSFRDQPSFGCLLAVALFHYTKHQTTI